MKITKPRLNHRVANPIETATNTGKGDMHSEFSKTKDALKDQFSGSGQDFISQLLGMDYGEEEAIEMGGEMKAGQTIDLISRRMDAKSKDKSQTAIRKLENKSLILAGIDYRSEVVHGSERLSRREAKGLDGRIQEILTELKRIVSSSSILRVEFAQISVEEKPANPGKYHQNLFEWLLIELRKIRIKVEDAGAWLAVMKSKKSQRKYGAMAKKHGTSFTLANERTPARQTG